MKRYLFICQHNFTRSKYGAEFFRGFLKGKGKKGKVDSAGIGFSSLFFGKKVNKKIVQNFDCIFVMEDYMRDYLIEKFGIDKKKIVVLNIKDIYGLFKRKTINDLDEILEKVQWRNYL